MAVGCGRVGVGDVGVIAPVVAEGEAGAAEAGAVADAGVDAAVAGSGVLVARLCVDGVGAGEPAGAQAARANISKSKIAIVGLICGHSNMIRSECFIENAVGLDALLCPACH